MDQSKLLNDLSDSYYELAGIELTMNLFSFYDGWTSDEKDEDGRARTKLQMIGGAKKLMESVSDILLKLYSEGEIDTDGMIAQAEQIREEIKRRTLVLANYTDRFKLYEYLINRLKPVDKKTITDINNDAAARDILTAIFSKNDNALINENIKFALSQLPIRMTKTRFYDILDLTCKKYIDGSSSSLTRECYMIETASGIGEELECESVKGSINLHDTLGRIAALAHEDMTQEEYDESEELLRSAVDHLVDSTDVFRSLAEIVNFAIVMLENRNRASLKTVSTIYGFRDVIETSVKGLISGKNGGMTLEIEKALKKTEGRLEFGFEKLLSLEAKAEAYIESTDETADADFVVKCRKLMSESVFADLSESEEDKPVDRKMAEEASESLKSKFEAAFAGDDRMMKRARMAAALGELPVFFDSRTEVMNYVRESIDGCRNMYEKLVSVKLVTDYMKE